MGFIKIFSLDLGGWFVHDLEDTVTCLLNMFDLEAVCVCLCVYVCLYVCVYVCMCVCVCVCVWAGGWG